MENPHAPQKDGALLITHYTRTLQQEEVLGLQVSGLKKPKRALASSYALGCLGSVETLLLPPPCDPVTACVCLISLMQGVGVSFIPEDGSGCDPVLSSVLPLTGALLPGFSVKPTRWWLT